MEIALMWSVMVTSPVMRIMFAAMRISTVLVIMLMPDWRAGDEDDAAYDDAFVLHFTKIASIMP